MATKSPDPQQITQGSSVYGVLRERVRTDFVMPRKPGDRVPGEKTLAAHFGVSPVTMSRALQELQNEGVLLRIPGKGTFLAEGNAPVDNGGASLIQSSTEQSPVAPWDDFNQDRNLGAPVAVRAAIMAPLGLSDGKTRYGNWEPRIVSRLEQLIQGDGGLTTILNRDLLPLDKAVTSIDSLRDARTNVVFLIHESNLPGENLLAGLQRWQHSDRNLIVIGITLGKRGEALINSIGFDSAYGAYLIGDHLRELNHKRIAYVMPEGGLQDSALDFLPPRLRALQDALSDSANSSVEAVEVPIPEDIEFPANRTKENRYLPTPQHDIWISCGDRAAQTMQLEEQYSALVFATDNMARGYIMARQKMSRPITASLVGYDDRAYTSSLGLTTVHPPIEEMAEYAFRLACSRLRQPFEFGRMDVILKPTLIRRTSTRPASGDALT